MLNKKYAYRLEFMMVTGILVILILIGRMFYLQIVKGSTYRRQAEGNRTRYTRILAPRGIIYDCNGEELANNKPGVMVSLVRRTDGYREETLERLSQLLNLPLEDIKETIRLSGGSSEPIRLVRNASPEVVDKVEENLRYLPGVMLEVQPVRNYPNKGLAVHALGYVGEISDYEISQGAYSELKAGDIIGKFGLENYYDSYLRGEDGSYREEVDVAGRVVQIMDKVDPKPGQGLVLTLDAKLQRIAEEAVDRQLKAIGARGCAVVALDPNNGEVKALVSRPGFDPNWFVNGISEKNWKYLNTDPFHPMTNKVIAGEYPPGSTFKIVTGSAALEEKKVTPDELIYDSATGSSTCGTPEGKPWGTSTSNGPWPLPTTCTSTKWGTGWALTCWTNTPGNLASARPRASTSTGRPRDSSPPRNTRRRSLMTNGTWGIPSTLPSVRDSPWPPPSRWRKCSVPWPPTGNGTSPIW